MTECRHDRRAQYIALRDELVIDVEGQQGTARPNTMINTLLSGINALSGAIEELRRSRVRNRFTKVEMYDELDPYITHLLTLKRTYEQTGINVGWRFSAGRDR